MVSHPVKPKKKPSKPPKPTAPKPTPDGFYTTGWAQDHYYSAPMPPPEPNYVWPGLSKKFKPLYTTSKPKKSIPMDRNKTYNKPLLEAFPHLKAKEQEGEIGLEIECEGMNLFSAPISWWGTHVDHSLREYKGHPPIEYVLRKPIPRKDVPKALTYLSKKLKEVGSDVVDSHRTSVHVHVNCQKLTFKEVVQFWALYAIFEELLVEFSGPDRRGNLFCLRAKDAEHFIQIMESGLQQDDYSEIFDKGLRYTACNMASVNKFGSLEFRSMRGTVDQELIQLWVDILLLIRDKALEYKDPQDIVKDFEKYGPEVFLKKITASRIDVYTLLQSFPEYKQKMWDGLRLMRDVAYAITWEERDESLCEKKPVVETEKSHQSPEVNAVLTPDSLGGETPQKIADRVWLVYKHEKYWLINYNPYFMAVNYAGNSLGLKGRTAIWVSTVTGQYMGDKYLLTGNDYEPDHPMYNAPPSPEEPEELEPDFETETMNEDHDDDF